MKTFLLSVAIGIAGMMLYTYFTSSPTPQTATYNSFLSSMEKSEIASVRIKSDGKTIVYRASEGSRITLNEVVLPFYVSAEFIDNLRRDHVLISVDPTPEKSSGIGMMLMMSIIPVLVLVGFLFWMSKKQAASQNTHGNSTHKMHDPLTNTVKFADVAGNPTDFEEVTEVVDFLKNPDQYTSTGAKIPKGVLLSGPSGVGKTLITKAIAGEAGVPFFTVSGSEFVEMFVGTGAARVRSLFEQAREASPCIVFIDEIDAIGENRNSMDGGGGSERKATLNQLLVEMDGFATDASVIVIAATNRPESLDPALIRPGRFDRNITINLPDIDAREKILHVHLRKIRLDNDIDARDIAKGTPGCSGAELASIVNEAALFAARNKKTTVDMADLENAKDKVLMGARNSTKMSVEEIELTAYHEAGHAIVGYCAPEHDPVYKVSVIPRGRALGVTMFIPDQDSYSLSVTKIGSMIQGLFGGRIAEEMLRGADGVTTGASSDIERATSIARRTVMDWGLSDLGITHFAKTRSFSGETNNFSEGTCQLIDAEIKKILESNLAKATEILEQHKSELKLMAELLIEKETIDATDIKLIMEGPAPELVEEAQAAEVEESATFKTKQVTPLANPLSDLT